MAAPRRLRSVAPEKKGKASGDGKTRKRERTRGCWMTTGRKRRISGLEKREAKATWEGKGVALEEKKRIKKRNKKVKKNKNERNERRNTRKLFPQWCSVQCSVGYAK